MESRQVVYSCQIFQRLTDTSGNYHLFFTNLSKMLKKTTFNRNVRPQGETRATLSPQTYLYQMSSSSRESFGILKSKGGNWEVSELWELGYKYRVRRVWRSAPKHNHRYQAVQIPTYGGATEETVVCIRTEPR